jgi:hypothetical protein
MTNEKQQAGYTMIGKVREAVGVFDDAERLQAAVDELQVNGFDRSSISTLADGHSVELALGRIYADIREIEDDTDAPRTVVVSRTSLGDAEGVLIGLAVYVPTVIAAGVLAAKGATSGTIAGAVLLAGAAGGLIGYLVARWLERRYLRRYHEQMSHGGMVVWVATRSAEEERRASEILRRAGARDVHVHELPIVAKPIPGWRGISYDLSFMKRLGM